MKQLMTWVMRETPKMLSTFKSVMFTECFPLTYECSNILSYKNKTAFQNNHKIRYKYMVCSICYMSVNFLIFRSVQNTLHIC